MELLIEPGRPEDTAAARLLADTDSGLFRLYGGVVSGDCGVGVAAANEASIATT